MTVIDLLGVLPKYERDNNFGPAGSPAYGSIHFSVDGIKFPKEGRIWNHSDFQKFLAAYGNTVIATLHFVDPFVSKVNVTINTH